MPPKVGVFEVTKLTVAIITSTVTLISEINELFLLRLSLISP